MGKKIRGMIFIAALGIFLVSAGYIANHYWDSYKENSAFDSLKTEDGHDLAALHKKNRDLVGWIKIEDTKIDYPVMQTPEEPEFYLRKDFDKNYSDSGTPFIDAACRMGKTKNYIIYGHNMKTGVMFHDLLKFEDESFSKKHKYFTFDEYRDGRQINGRFRIIAFFRSEIKSADSKEFKYYEFQDITDKKKYDKYVRSVRRIAEFRSDEDARWPAQLVTLSTCAYHADEGRFVLVGVKE